MAQPSPSVTPTDIIYMFVAVWRVLASRQNELTNARETGEMWAMRSSHRLWGRVPSTRALQPDCCAGRDARRRCFQAIVGLDEVLFVEKPAAGEAGLKIGLGVWCLVGLIFQLTVSPTLRIVGAQPVCLSITVWAGEEEIRDPDRCWGGGGSIRVSERRVGGPALQHFSGSAHQGSAGNVGNRTSRHQGIRRSRATRYLVHGDFRRSGFSRSLGYGLGRARR